MKKFREKYKIEKIEKIEEHFFLNIFLIISYKFGAYIKIFWYTLLTNWHYM